MRKLTIGKRVAGAFGAIGVLIVLMIGIILVGLSAESSAFDSLARQNAKAMEAADFSYTALALVHNGSIIQTEGRAGNLDSARAQEAINGYNAAAAELDAVISTLNSTDLDADERRRLEEVEADIRAFRDAESKATGLYQQGTPSSIKAADDLIAAVYSSIGTATIAQKIQTVARDVELNAESVAGELREEFAATAARTRTLVIVCGVVSLCVAAVMAVITTRSITRPIGESVKTLERLADGDLRVKVDDDSTDEVGQMARALNTAVNRMNATVVGIEVGAERLAASSAQLSEVAQRMSAAAEESASQAQSVSAAAEEVSHGIQTVAVSAEELGSSEEEIARNTSNAATIAETAIASAGAANVTVERLSQSSNEIGAVVNVIASVAEQINLLALNATIEAARAGVAGESFAVVASEVKNLARKTAKSSDEIRAKVEVMQQTSQDAIGAIGEITSIIDQISGTQIQVAAAVEEQTTATGEIGRSMSQAAIGSTEIARSITEVAEAAATNSQAASETQAMAHDVASVVAEMNDFVSRFTINKDSR